MFLLGFGRPRRAGGNVATGVEFFKEGEAPTGACVSIQKFISRRAWDAPGAPMDEEKQNNGRHETNGMRLPLSVGLRKGCWAVCVPLFLGILVVLSWK